MSNCLHESFDVHTYVMRLTDVKGGRVTGFTTETKVNCAECNMPFQWLGLQMGISPNSPTTSADRLELRAPIIPLEEI